MIKIENQRPIPVAVTKWSEAKQLTVYRSPASDLLVMCLGRKAVALRVSGVTSAKTGDIWEPGEDSTWVEVEATLQLNGDAP
jgi:hypothetical protein